MTYDGKMIDGLIDAGERATVEPFRYVAIVVRLPEAMTAKEASYYAFDHPDPRIIQVRAIEITKEKAYSIWV